MKLQLDQQDYCNEHATNKTKIKKGEKKKKMQGHPTKSYKV